MPFQFASADRIPELLKLWKDAFPEDSAEDAGSFLSNVIREDYCAVWIEDGRTVSMTFLLPATLMLASNNLNLRYIYAASTLTEYRGKGLFGRLLTEAHARMRERGIDACFLRPAKPGLFSYYERFGYKPYFYHIAERLHCDKRNDSDPDTMRQILTESQRTNQTEVRNALLRSHPAWVRWPEEFVKLAVSAAGQTGGAGIAAEGCWAVCEPNGNKLLMREFLCRAGNGEKLLSMTASYFSADTVELRRPLRPGESLPSEAFGMICALNEDAGKRIEETKAAPPYMGLAFD